MTPRALLLASLASLTAFSLPLAPRLGPAQAAAQETLKIYHARHRSAAELARLAEAALGGNGRVAVDERTASLVLAGDPAAVERALELLAAQDVPLRTLRLHYALRRAAELEAAGVAVRWGVSAGGFRIGTLPGPESGVEVGLGATSRRGRESFRSELRLVEGGSGLILTGEALPVAYSGQWLAGVDYVPADSGFEAQASVLGDGRVRVALRPFAGRFEAGALRYTEAASEVIVAPGETIVVGSTARSGSDRSFGSAGGGIARANEELLLLFGVDVEP
jgi:hypothetical protein